MKFKKELRPALICFGIMTVLCGALYTAAITGISQLVFKDQANGSIIAVHQKDGTKIEMGSRLLAQSFTKPEYLVGRPAGVSNLSPVSKEEKTLVQERIDWWHTLDPENEKEIPMDLVTGSGSGVDPHITPQAAEYQVTRIAKASGMTEEEVRHMIKKYTSGRLLGFMGEPSVDVFMVNLALDGLI